MHPVPHYNQPGSERIEGLTNKKTGMRYKVDREMIKFKASITEDLSHGHLTFISDNFH